MAKTLGNTIVTIKAKCGDDVRRFSQENPVDFGELQTKIATLFSIDTGALRVRWTDEDGDAITIASSQDLSEALAANPSLLRLDVASTGAAEDDSPPKKKKNAWAIKADKKIQWLASALEVDAAAAKALVHQAIDGDAAARVQIADAAHSKLPWLQHDMEAGKKVERLAKALKISEEEARAMIHSAIDGDAAAQEAISQAKARGTVKHMIEKRTRFLCEALGQDENAVKQLVHQALDGDDSAAAALLQARAGRGERQGKGCGHGRPLVRLLARMSGLAKPEARSLLEAAEASDAQAQAKIGAVLKQSAALAASSSSESSEGEGGAEAHHEARIKLGVKLLGLLAAGELEEYNALRAQIKHRMGHGKCGGRGGHHGEHHGGPRGRPLVKALVRLTGMERHDAADALALAMAGDVAAQARIGAALEAVDIDSSSGTSSEEEGMGHPMKRVAVRLLNLLASGELEAFEEAREEARHCMHKMHKLGKMKGGKGGCGKGKGKGKGGKGFGIGAALKSFWGRGSCQ